MKVVWCKRFLVKMCCKMCSEKKLSGVKKSGVKGVW